MAWEGMQKLNEIGYETTVSESLDDVDVAKQGCMDPVLSVI